MSPRIFAFLIVAVLSSQSFGQIVYEPVRYQHGGDTKYFYGGSQALVHRYAVRELEQRSYNGYGVFSGSDHSARREMFNQRDAVYTDDLPLQDASRFGYTANDARNQAYAGVPLYFRKSELLATAERQLDGTLVVPAQSNVVGRVYERETHPTTNPATTKGAIIIIPKRLLDQPVKAPDRPMASAR